MDVVPGTGGRRARLAVASRSLAELVERDEQAAALVASNAQLPDATGYRLAIERALEADGWTGLRIEKRRRLAEIAARDVAGEIGFEAVGRALADLADACLEAALAAVEAPPGMAIIAMGKLGGRELNYYSDVDVMFVTEADAASSAPAATELLARVGEFAPEGRAYQIDADLRPEGRAGALVRTLDGYLEYYGRWAEAWEFQALIKARRCAGNRSVGERFVEAIDRFVYPPHISSERVAGIRAMKERVESYAARSSRRSGSDAGDVKLGPGGIRDIEFAVQLLQLVHGGADHSVRSPTTLVALDNLVQGGYVADDDGAGLGVAYRWLRTVEHRLQLRGERRVHRLPVAPEARAEVARAMGFAGTPRAGALEQFETRHKAVLGDVRGRFDKLFYRPMIESLSGLGEHRLSKDALGERLRVLGFRDVQRASEILARLVAGTSRRARMLRVLAPAMLRWLASTPTPDAGLFSFLTLGEALGDRVDPLGALRDNPPGLAFLAKVLGHSRLLGEVLAHVPEEISSIASGPDRPPRSVGGDERARLVREASASLEWRAPEARLDGLRRFKRRALLDLALDDLAGAADAEIVGVALAEIADACLEAAVAEGGAPITVIGMGKLGGRELNYASDVDVMFVHDGDPQAAEKAAEQLLKSIGEVTPEGQAFRIDPSIRPEGKAGTLARSLDSFLEYYERWARAWEHQALIKARVAAGRVDMGEKLVALTRRFAFPEDAAPEAVAEIRHLKARMEKERIPRGTDPRRNFKLGPGGMSDVEFAAQLIQIQHGHAQPDLQCAGTLDALRSARQLDVIDEGEAAILIESYTFLSRLRNRLFFLMGRPTDALPVQPERLEALGIAMGFRDQPRQELEDAYLRATRRTRRVAEILIYG